MAEFYPRFQRGYDGERDAAADMRIVAPYTMTKYDRCAVLHGLVKYVEEVGLAGSLVECGVWRGGSSGLMALSNMRYGTRRRKLHLFDSWSDWPDPTLQDGNRFHDLASGTLKKADNSFSMAACRELLEKRIAYPQEEIVYHQGLFHETVPQVGDVLQIAVLRIDCDWYESTKLCLDELVPRVVTRGVVLIDDYGYCDGARRAVDEFLAEHDHRPLHFADYSCRYFIKR